VITCYIDTAFTEFTPFEALGRLVDACEGLTFPLEIGVEQDLICSIDFTSNDGVFLFTGVDLAEMRLLICVFYLCCYIRCCDTNGNFVDRDGSWRRLVARFALMSFEDIELEAASDIAQQLNDEEALLLLECVIKRGAYDI
jgi:hypothetical protein